MKAVRLAFGLGDLSFQKTHPNPTHGLPAFSESLVFSSLFHWLVTALETIPGTTHV